MVYHITSATLLILFCAAGSAFGQGVQYVIHISVDGGGSSYIQSLIENDALPNFNRLVTGGASTFNARDDYDYTVTLPNHVTQVTGRGVEGVDGHNWTDNEDPLPDQTIHGNKGSYVAGVFDVAHDNGLRTGMYAGKTKFGLFDTSYNAVNGAIDLTGVDNGRGKLDSYVCDENTSALTDSLITAMQADPFNYVFVHYADPDFAGHNSGWGSDEYNAAMIAVDGYLGRIFDMVASDATFTGKTAIVLTADHGGKDYDHSDPAEPLDYTIPFGVWGPGVTAGADLYALNTASCLDPGTDRPPYGDAMQPIRNGDAPNLELQLLGLPSVPGSTINVAQNLAVPEPASLGLLVMGLASFSACRLFAVKQK
jgi:hypothetical protein